MIFFEVIYFFYSSYLYFIVFSVIYGLFKIELRTIVCDIYSNLYAFVIVEFDNWLIGQLLLQLMDSSFNWKKVHEIYTFLAHEVQVTLFKDIVLDLI